MYYYKILNSDGEIKSVQSRSAPLTLDSAVEITEAEHDEIVSTIYENAIQPDTQSVISETAELTAQLEEQEQLNALLFFEYTTGESYASGLGKDVTPPTVEDFSAIQHLFGKGLYTENHLQAFLAKGIITDTEYATLTAETEG